MIYIGAHVSVAKGWEAMGKTTLDLGGDTFAFFLRSPRGGAAKQVVPEDAAALRSITRENGFGPIVAHAPYTMNLCAVKEYVVEHAEEVFREDLQNLEDYLPGQYMNFHPGSHVGRGADVAIPIIADAMNRLIEPGQSTTILLETMAGKGSEVGRTFEELRAILDAVRPKTSDCMGVCLDTCHVWDGGYDLNDLDGVLAEFDRVIGLDRLKAIHLNDSKNPCGAHKDRHEKLGQGHIGSDNLRAVVTHPKLQGLPFILETPNELPGYKTEIETIRTWMTD